jgi:PP-loop superfamily ATP-utilizing enzyme
MQHSRSDSSVEDELQKIIETSNNKKTVRYEIKITSKLTMDFDIKDEIFDLTEKVGTKIRSNNCNSCQKDISSTIVQFCDFCGSRACKVCMHKNRCFYGN